MQDLLDTWLHGIIRLSIHGPLLTFPQSQADAAASIGRAEGTKAKTGTAATIIRAEGTKAETATGKGFAGHTPRSKSGVAVFPHELCLRIVFAHITQHLAKDPCDKQFPPHQAHIASDAISRFHLLACNFIQDLHSSVCPTAIAGG